MSKILEDLLGRLEEATAELVQLTATTAGEANSLAATQLLALIDRRGSLIDELHAVIATEPPASYQEANRMVVIHAQGNRIEGNIHAARNTLQLTLAQKPKHSAYIDRLDGLLNLDRSQVIETA